MRRFAGPDADHVAGFVHAHVVQPQAGKQALQFLPASLLVERRRGDLANPDLLLDGLWFVAPHGLERGPHGGILRQFSRSLRQTNRGPHRQKQRYRERIELDDVHGVKRR